MYGDEEGDGYDKEIPKEFWHDQKRVDQWIERRKEKRREKAESQ